MVTYGLTVEDLGADATYNDLLQFCEAIDVLLDQRRFVHLDDAIEWLWNDGDYLGRLHLTLGRSDLDE